MEEKETRAEITSGIVEQYSIIRKEDIYKLTPEEKEAQLKRAKEISAERIQRMINAPFIIEKEDDKDD